MAGELSDLANDLQNWGDSAKAIQFTQLGVKTSLIAVNIEGILREKIEAQESRTTCVVKQK
jgi:hypothetical protein